MRTKNIFYFHDNKVQFTKKDEIKTYTFKIDTLLYGKVIDIEAFIKELKQFLKKEKILGLITPSITIITPYNFYNTDKEIMLMAFNSLGINKIEFINETSLITKKNDSSFLNIHETYLIQTIYINNKTKNYLYPYNLFKNKDQMLNFILKKNPDLSYYLFGSNKDIPNFVEILKQSKVKQVHYYNNYQTYIIEKLKKNA